MIPNGSVLKPAPASTPRWQVFLAGGVVVLAALAAYYNSFSGAFVLDDNLAIAKNPSIKRLWSALTLKAASTTSGRPILNLTFALNYALGGMNVWGYHAVNLLIHTLAGLALFGLVRRTLLRPAAAGLRRAGPCASSAETDATLLALAIATIWVVHPLQTEAVTYISQRAESLMGLFYLLTLYCFVRGTEARGQIPESGSQSVDKIEQPPGRYPLASVLWLLSSVLCCLLGALTKEVIATAPVMVLLYDRTFAAGSFREAWRLRRRYYLGLACTWLLQACVIRLKRQGVGFDQKVTWWHYALTSCRSVVLYLKMAFWPHPLVFDYGTRVIQHATEAVPYALVLGLLLAGVLIALRHRPVIGFAGAWFFVILAPASSIIPVAGQPMAEHRLYLSLAAVIAGVVLGLYRLIGRRSLIIGAALAAGLGWLSVQRNRDYKSELSIWTDTIAKCPDNERAHDNLGNILADMPGKLTDAIAQYRAAVQIKPDYAEAHNNLGNALLQVPGRLPDAMAEFEAAQRDQPDYAVAYYNLGNAFVRSGRLSEAIAQYKTALRFEPASMEIYNNLANTLRELPGRLPDAIAAYESALRIDPDSADTHTNLANTLLHMSGHLTDAVAQYEAALRLKPDSAEAHNYLGAALLNLPGRLPDAMAQFQAAIRIDPDFAQAHYNLGNAWYEMPGRLPDAIAEYEAALRIDPASVEAHVNLGNAWLKTPGRLADAIAQFEAALRIDPNLEEAHNNLGNALFNLPGRLPDAIAEYEAALRINPNAVNTHYNLGSALLKMPGRLPDAIAQFKAALRLKPDLKPAQDMLDQLQNPNKSKSAGPTDSSLHLNGARPLR